MKVRIGIGASGQGLVGDGLVELCESLLEHRFDSIWIPEVLSQPGVDPLVALAYLGGRLERLKLGTTFLVPGRNVLRLARQLAALDQLSGGRLLVAAVSGLPRGAERTAVGVAPKERTAELEASLGILRSLLAGEPTDVPGPAGVTEGVVLDPLPKQQPLEIWLGGMVPAALRRCGQLGDGWLPAMVTPIEAAEGKRTIDEEAERVGRSIDPEHFGVSIGYATEPLGEHALARLRMGAGERDLAELVPTTRDGLRQLIERYLEVGFSKFVVRPIVPPASWAQELAELAQAVGDLQT